MFCKTCLIGRKEKMVTLGLLIFFAVVVAISALFGLCRGMNKAVIRIMTLVLAAVLTFVVAVPVTNAILDNIQINGQTLSDMILEALSGTEMMAMFLEAAPLLREAILVVPAFALSILVFPVVFLVLKFLSWILFLCIQKPLRRAIFKDSCNKEEAKQKPMGLRVGKRFAGMGIGIVTGVLIFAMLLAPIFGVFSMLPSSSTLSNALDTMVEQQLLSASDAQLIRDCYGVTDSGLVKFYGAIGVTAAGKAYINSVSKIEAEGQVVYLADEFDNLLTLVQTAVDGGLLEILSKAEDPDTLYALLADKDMLDALMQDLFRSQLLRAAVPEVMAILTENVAKTMSVPADKNAVYSGMMEDVALAVQSAQIDYAGIQAYELANGITYAVILTAATDGEDAPLLTEEEYEAQIQKLVELATAISSILDQALSGDNAAFADSIANHIVNDVKSQAAAGGQEALDNFDVQSSISNIDAEDVDAGEGDASALLEQLNDQEKFQTDVTTVEDITVAIRQSVKDALADDTTAAATATTLVNVVSDLADAVSSAMDENGNINAANMDFEKIASAVTQLQNSTLKDVGSSVLDIVAAGDLGDNSMVSDVLGAVKEGYENGEDIGGTISSAGALIGLGSAMNGGEENQEAMVDSLTSLINNLNEFTIGLLPNILSTETITSMGVPAEYADATFGVIETLLKELMKLKGAEDYTNEVNSILSLYNLATSGMEDFSQDDVAGLVDYALKSDAIYNTLMSVSTSNPFGIEISNADERAAIVEAIEENFAQSGQTARERDIYTAVAKLLGLDAEVDLG